jgi:hypothetical protein
LTSIIGLTDNLTEREGCIEGQIDATIDRYWQASIQLDCQNFTLSDCDKVDQTVNSHTVRRSVRPKARQSNRQAFRQTDSQTVRQSDSQTGSQAVRQSGSQAVWQSGSQSVSQSGRQAGI